MKRRNFLQGLGLTAVALGINNKIAASDIPKEISTYKGFKLYWSEFSKTPDSEKISGYWLAIKPIGKEEDEFIGFYSCTGGFSDEYQLGKWMNINVLRDHKFLTIRSSNKDKEEEMERAFERIKEEINSYYCVGRII